MFKNSPFSAWYSTLILNSLPSSMSASLPFIIQSCFINFQKFKNSPFSAQYSTLIINKSPSSLSAPLPLIIQPISINLKIPPFLPNIALWYSKNYHPLCLHHCCSFFSHILSISKKLKIPPFCPIYHSDNQLVTFL